MILHLLKSDSDPSGVWAETATVCLPGSNRIDSVVAEMPLGRPGWKKVLSAAAALTAIFLCIEWTAMTSGMAEGTWSVFHKRHHSVTLHWDASTSSNVVGYNIYRGEKKGRHEKKLNSVPVNGLTFTDTDVKSGKTYYYVTRAVNNAGKESIDSNETAATIP